METVEASAVFIVEDKIKTKKEILRLNRLMKKINSKLVVNCKSKDLKDIIKENNFYSRTCRTGLLPETKPVIIFTGFDWDKPYNNPLKPRIYEPFEQGQFSFADYRDKKQLYKQFKVKCNSGFEIHTAFGCLHRCRYCHIDQALTIMLDIEKFTEKLQLLIKNNPQQKLYKYDNQSDIPLFEPEYGAIIKLIKFFAGTDKHLMLYSKSDNFYYLPDFDIHKRHTICCWTLNPNEVAKDYEINAPTLEERLNAAASCQSKGYRIRFRFSPIIPVKDWKSKYSEMIEQIFLKTDPEVICLETLCHTSKEEYNKLFNDLEYGAKDKIDEYELFEHEVRKEIYEFFIEKINEQTLKRNKNPKLALCLETGRMWQELYQKLNQGPNTFYCCCGEKCA